MALNHFFHQSLLWVGSIRFSVPWQSPHWIVSPAPVECLLDGRSPSQWIQLLSCCRNLRAHRYTLLRENYTDLSNDKCIVSTVYPRKAIVCVKECDFLAFAEVRRGKTLLSRLLNLYMMRQSKFPSTSAALPCISPLPCSSRQQFRRAFAPAQRLLINPAPFCFSPLLLTRGNKTIKKILKLIFF